LLAPLLFGFPLLLTFAKLAALPAFDDAHHQLLREAPHG
jgi:hypothetical protein